MIKWLLFSGFIGALFATLLSVFYSYYIFQTRRRSDLTMEVVSWIDDVYDRLITIHAQREAIFTGSKFGISNEEYRTMVKEVKAMLLGSKMRTRIALVYGSGNSLRKFDALREEFINITELLLQAEKDTWDEANKKINQKLSDVIDPLRESTEHNFIAGAASEAIAKDFTKTNLPTLYVPVDEKGLVVTDVKSQGGSVDNLGKFISEQSSKFFDTLLALVRVGIVLLIAAWLVWIAVGKPNIREKVRSRIEKMVVVNPQVIVEVKGEPRFDLYTTTPLEYGLAAGGEITPIKQNEVLVSDKPEKALTFGLKNNENVNLANAIFMIFVPQEIAVINEWQWRPGWQELGAKNGRWFIKSIKDDIMSGGKIPLSPPIQVRFPKDGEYQIQYKFFADNFTLKNGGFVVKVSLPKVKR